MMSQSHDELVQGLTYVRDTIAKMQGISHEYAQAKEGLREEKQSIDRRYLFCHKRALVHDALWMAAFAGAATFFDWHVLAIYAACLALAHWSWSLRGLLRKFIYMATAISAVMTIHLGWKRDMTLMLAIIAAGVAIFLLNVKVRNWKVASDNRKIARNNQAVKEKLQALTMGYRQLEDELKEKTASWYPLDYYNMEAAEFFLKAVRNRRAESVKEMVGLFEVAAEHRRLLELQERQAEEEQRRQQVLAQNQRVLQEKLEFADKMDRYARFFRQRAENADRSMRERKLSNIEQSLWNIENELNRR